MPNNELWIKNMLIDSVKDLILKDSCPFNTATCKVPLLSIKTLLFKNLVKFFFFE